MLSDTKSPTLLLGAVRMRLDLLRPRGKRLGAAGEADFSARRLADNGDMRIGNGGLLQISVRRVRFFLVVALHLYFDARAVRAVPLQPSLLVDVGPVPGDVD